MNKRQRDQVESHLQSWAEWSRSNSSGFSRAQYGVVGSSDHKSICLVSDSVDAIERGMTLLHERNENLHAMIKWLWLELNVDLGNECCALRLHVSERTFRRYRDSAYVVLHDELVRSGLIIGKRIGW